MIKYAIHRRITQSCSGFLDVNEVTQLINDALNHMKAGRTATSQEIQTLINNVDKNKDGKIAKPELLEIFKMVANK